MPTVSPGPVITANPDELPTVTLTPTFTPTETGLPPLAVLLSPPGSDAARSDVLYTGLADFFSQAGMRWEVRSQLGSQELTPDLRVVILLPPNVEAANLAASAPQTQFLAIGISGLTVASNLSVIGVEGERPDQQGFIAGLIAAMITPDWRVGVISDADTAAGKAARQGFLNGVVYFCGLCNPYHGPIFDYPLYVELPASASQADWQAAVEVLISKAVETVYVFADVPDPGLLEYLAQTGVNVIGGVGPPEGLRASWVATIEADPLEAALETLPDLLGGRGGMNLPMPVVIREVNPTLFTPGKQERLEELRLDLLTGVIDTGINPFSGEPR